MSENNEADCPLHGFLRAMMVVYQYHQEKALDELITDVVESTLGDVGDDPQTRAFVENIMSKENFVRLLTAVNAHAIEGAHETLHEAIVPHYGNENLLNALLASFNVMKHVFYPTVAAYLPEIGGEKMKKAIQEVEDARASSDRVTLERVSAIIENMRNGDNGNT